MSKKANTLGSSNIPFAALYWQLFFGVLPFTLILSIMAFTGQKSSNFNGKDFQGFYGALIPLLTHPVAIFMFTVIFWFLLFIGRNLMKIFIR